MVDGSEIFMSNVVFKGLVARTKKMTKPDQTQLIATGPSVAVAHFQSQLQLPVAFFLEYSKTDKNQLQSVATGFL